MKLITSPKQTYLLEAGLDVLHYEGIEWLNDISFWRDEVAFLSALFIGKTLKQVPVNSKKEMENISSHLIYLSIDKLNYLETLVKEHELYLGKLFSSKYAGDETVYRQKHHEMAQMIRKFSDELKEMKRKIFALVEKIKKNNK